MAIIKVIGKMEGIQVGDYPIEYDPADLDTQQLAWAQIRPLLEAGYAFWDNTEGHRAEVVMLEDGRVQLPDVDQLYVFAVISGG